MRKKNAYNVAVVGVGVVGIEMLRVLKQRNFPINKLKVFARTARQINVDGQVYDVGVISSESFDGIDIALFAGTEGEKGAAVTYAADAVKRGAVVIDNGADFRMENDVPLVVPEVNPQDAMKYRKRGIIANPNCSTIQMVVALSPIHKVAKIKRVIVTTLQAASGAGKGAVEQLKKELDILVQKGCSNIIIKDFQDRALPQQLAFNVFPHIGGFSESDFTSEEWKMVKETHKIMHADKMKVSATTVRVPVRTGHSESVYFETKKDISAEDIKKLLKNAPGVELVDSPKDSAYPLPINCEGKDAVYVGRVRKDPFVKNGFWLWNVSDNLRKGAALNAVQIAELLIRK